MNVLEKLKSGLLYLDGGSGTLLQARGLSAGTPPEAWLLSRPDEITAIHREYYEAGSNIVCTNTFGVNSLKYGDDTAELVRIAIDCARRASDTAAEGQTDRFVALDIGPLGHILKPLGDLGYEQAIEIFKNTIRAGKNADLIFIETMSDVYEARAALIAAKECSDLPVFVSCAFGEDGKTMTGSTPAVVASVLGRMGADAVGMNCSLGPAQLLPLVEQFHSYLNVPLIMKPNAGLPRVIDGKTVYDINEKQFAEYMRLAVQSGARVIGGCCGTTPATIRELTAATEKMTPAPVLTERRPVVCSLSGLFEFGGRPALVGERLNPTGRKKLKEALQNGNYDFIVEQALAQREEGADILDINAGLPGIDESGVLKGCVLALHGVCDAVLQIDTGNAEAMERALRIYGGCAVINSLECTDKSMNSIFPLVKKYGGMVICLTIDENGIPADAQGRYRLAERIAERADSFGIDRSNLIFDTLTLTAASERGSAKTTLDAVRLIKDKLGCRCIVGASNISFGLPRRDILTASYITMAFSHGVDAAIVNTSQNEIMKAYHSFLALYGYDSDCAEYVDYASKTVEAEQIKYTAPNNSIDKLKRAVLKGLRDEAAQAAHALTSDTDPMEIINSGIIPALNEIGEGYESGKTFLPQLLKSADAAAGAFEVIRAAMPSVQTDGDTIVLATVKGDIHDIGKNIVRAMLENYGYRVIDLGKDVPARTIADEVIKSGAKIAALSALMTTTVPAMRETIELIHTEAPGCRVMVGGAVMNAEYAAEIGADAYSANASEAVRVAARLCGK